MDSKSAIVVMKEKLDPLCLYNVPIVTYQCSDKRVCNPYLYLPCLFKKYIFNFYVHVPSSCLFVFHVNT